MNEKQFHINEWLSRTDDYRGELQQLKNRREEILCSMSGVAKYETDGSKGGSDNNPTEAKNIEYTLLCERIERIEHTISMENVKTMNVINKVMDSKLRGMMVARYINHYSWKKVGEYFYYGKSSSYNYRDLCLDAVAPFIPKEAFAVKNQFESQKDWTILE